MRWIVLIALTVCVAMSCNPPLKLKTDTLPEAQKMAKALKSQALVVRIPTQGKKINFLRSVIRDTSLDPRTLRRYEKLLDDALESDREYLSMIDSIFNVTYSVTPVFFVPDSSFREFKAGSDKVFVDGTGSLISGQSIPESYLLLLTDDNKYKFRLFNQEGYRLPRIMPHKRDAFLPYMQILWQKEKYVADQVVYFQSRLSEISQLYPL